MILLTTACVALASNTITPDYTPRTEPAIGQWLQPPMLDYEGPSARVGVAAHHHLGIARVEFYTDGLEGDLNGDGRIDGFDLSDCLAHWDEKGRLLNTILGNWGMRAPVVAIARNETVDPSNGTRGWFADIDTSLLGTGRIELSARLIPNDGVVTTLSGDPMIEFSKPGLVMFVNAPRPIAVVPTDYPTIGEAWNAGHEHIQLLPGEHELSPIGNYGSNRPAIIEGIGKGVVINRGRSQRGLWIYRNITFRHADPSAQEEWLGNSGPRGMTIWSNCTIDGHSTAAPMVNKGTGGPVYLVDCVITNHFQFYKPRMAIRTWFDGILGDIMKSGFLNIMSDCRLTRHGWKGDHGNDVPEGTSVHSDFWQSNYTGNAAYREENIVFSYNEAWDGNGGQKVFASFGNRKGVDARISGLAFVGNALSSWAGTSSGDDSGNAVLFSLFTAGDNMLFMDNILFGQCLVGGGADPDDGIYRDPFGRDARKWRNILWSNNYRTSARREYVMPTIDGPEEFFYVSRRRSVLDFDLRFTIGRDTFPHTSPITGIHYVNETGSTFSSSRKRDYLDNDQLTP